MKSTLMKSIGFVCCFFFALPRKFKWNDGCMYALEDTTKRKTIPAHLPVPSLWAQGRISQSPAPKPRAMCIRGTSARESSSHSCTPQYARTARGITADKCLKYIVNFSKLYRACSVHLLRHTNRRKINTKQNRRHNPILGKLEKEERQRHCHQYHEHNLHRGRQTENLYTPYPTAVQYDLLHYTPSYCCGISSRKEHVK